MVESKTRSPKRLMTWKQLYQRLAPNLDTMGDSDRWEFISNADLSFPRMEAAQLEESNVSDVEEILFHVGTLFDSTSPSPDVFLDLVSKEQAYRDYGSDAPFIDFLEIFNTRLLQIFLAAIKKNGLARKRA